MIRFFWSKNERYSTYIDQKTTIRYQPRADGQKLNPTGKDMMSLPFVGQQWGAHIS